MTAQPRKLFIKTYGCQMNVYDSIKMGDLLKPHGFELSTDMPTADLVILNTCHIREKAAEKVYCELGRIREQKEERAAIGEQMVIAVAGCVAQAEGEEIFARAPYVDIVVGPQSYQNLPALLEQIKRKEKWAINLDFPEVNKFDSIQSLDGSQGVSAFIAVQEGCDKFCHFCVVPYTRGAEYSRSVADIYREAVALAARGTKEIQLLGQNVSAYHGEGPDGEVWSLGKLIKLIAKIEGIERIRYTTSHPRDMIDEELFEAHADEAKLMPFLHLPIQSGSDRMLEAMNRKHTCEFYLQTIERFRKVRPGISFSSDFIVGYPGETDQDFADTLQLIRQVEFSQCYSYKYSPRPGTPASVLTTQVPEEVKAARLLELQELIKSYQQKFNKQFLGKTIKVLFDKKGKHNGQLIGRSEYMQSVFVEAPDSCLNKILEVEVYTLEPNSLGSKIIKY